MTLCIAARAVQEDGNPCVVCCFDTPVETTVAGSEHGFKLRPLGKGWNALMSGTMAEADHLARMYRVHLAQTESAVGFLVSDSLRSVAWKYKEFLVDRYLHSSFAISREEFYSSAHGRLPSAITEQTLYEISNIESECELILFNLTPPEDGGIAEVFRMDRNFSVTLKEDFTSIGSGANDAESWLHFRGQHCRVSRNDTIYNLYEAKKFGEISPGVGGSTYLGVFQIDGKMLILQRGTLKELDARYKKLGPRAIKPNTVKIDFGKAIEYTWSK